MIKCAVLALIKTYQRCISPLLPPSCRFVPTCSEYFCQAVEAKGAVRGTLLGIRRLLRCNPFSSGGHDPVN